MGLIINQTPTFAPCGCYHPPEKLARIIASWPSRKKTIKNP
jgi:hypothetical protein